MRLRLLGLSMTAMLALFAFAGTTLAQSEPIRGKVSGKALDGKVIPIAGATIEIVRTDIAGKYAVTSDSKGEYVQVGVPFQGVYMILVSAPNWAPDYRDGVKAGRPERQDFQLSPGDGHKLTPEEIKKATPAAPGDDAKLKAARAKVEDENRKITENNAQMKTHFDAGLKIIDEADKLYRDKNWKEAPGRYQDALKEFQAVVAIDEKEPASNGNIAYAREKIAVSRFNSGDKPGALQEFKEAAAASRRAIELKPDNMGFHKYLAEVQLLVGQQYNDSAAALESAGEYIKIAEADAAIPKKEDAAIDYSKAGDGYSAGQKITEAMAAYNKALALDPNTARAYTGMAKAILNSPELATLTDQKALTAKYREALEFAKKGKSVAKAGSVDAKDAELTVQGLEEAVTSLEGAAAAEQKNAGKKKKP